MITKSLQTAVATAMLKLKRFNARTVCIADAPGTAEDFRNTAELARRAVELPFDRDTLLVCPHPLGIPNVFLAQLIVADSLQFLNTPLLPHERFVLVLLIAASSDEASVFHVQPSTVKRRSRLLVRDDTPVSECDLERESDDMFEYVRGGGAKTTRQKVRAWMESAYPTEETWSIATVGRAYRELSDLNSQACYSLCSGFVASIGPFLSPCGYQCIRSTFNGGIGDDEFTRKRSASTPIYTVFRHNRMYVEPDVDDVSTALFPLIREAHRRREHYRFQWKSHGINRLELPDSADERKALAVERGLRPIHVRECAVRGTTIITGDTDCRHTIAHPSDCLPASGDTV